MHDLLSHLLPTLDSFGIWSYWIIGLFSFLEGWWVSGAIAPGTLVVDAGGALVRLGHLDFFDLVWFVAIGAILGGEASWHSGKWLGGRIRMPQNKRFLRAQDLVRRRGPFAVVLGRFLGPIAGLAALAAALSGMSRRQFVIWNIVSSFLYALTHVMIGYAAGEFLARLSPYLPRLALPLGLLAAVIAITWIITRQIQRGMPALRAGFSALRNRAETWPPAARATARHPRAARFLARRFDPGQGGGLLTSAVVVLVAYLTGLLIDGALDLKLVPDTVALDQRTANLAHAYWSPGWLRAAGWFTQAGHAPVATLAALGCILGFAAFGRRAAALGLAVAVVGNAITVTALKLLVGRARPELSYFLETSNSFPSGHAAISVAFYGTLALMLWRERIIGPTTALIAGVGMATSLGLTRIYLVEHYLSDVLNGWVVGGIWLVIGLGLAEGMRQKAAPPPRIRRLAGLCAALICFCGAGWLALYHTKSPAERVAIAATIVPDLSDDTAIAALPTEVVSLDGSRRAPVGLLVAGATASDLGTILTAAGWSEVPPPSLLSVLTAIRSDLEGLHPGPSATAPLAFYRASPAEVTLRDNRLDSLLRVWTIGTTPTGRPLLALAFGPEGNTPTWQEDHVIEAVCTVLRSADQGQDIQLRALPPGLTPAATN